MSVFIQTCCSYVNKRSLTIIRYIKHVHVYYTYITTLTCIDLNRMMRNVQFSLFYLIPGSSGVHEAERVTDAIFLRV